LPRHWRHEALSVRLGAMHREFEGAVDRMLVLWLIGTHHGYGRPFFPHTDTKDGELRQGLLTVFGDARALESGCGPQSLAFMFEGYDWAGIFEALKERYGIWGLARLETFIRLADHRASEIGAAPTTKAAE
ncbi:MAG: CRISPR-associated endonuclease/helicase Cas3, partial [Aliidongia sp.]|nr:CRISPR-associated endonuclease/helicase Cas3 [Aliidongia sp.]